MNHIHALELVFEYFKGLAVNGVVPINLQASSVVGTVQDDPFDTWVAKELKKALPAFEITHAGKLTTPDIVLRDRESDILFGIEIKKLIQLSNGSDSRGLTIDYNSCLPCGKTFITIDDKDVEIPNFYLFCLLNQQSTGIVSLILMDGDFINNNIELHKLSKTTNYTEYKHGPYGEGSIRHRNMYTYPNPMNSKIKCFHLDYSFVIKETDSISNRLTQSTRYKIIRDEVTGKSIQYLVFNTKTFSQTSIPIITNIFGECKKRSVKKKSPFRIKLLK